MAQKTLIRSFSKQNFTKIPNLTVNSQGGIKKSAAKADNFTLIKRLGKMFTILLLICCTCVCGYSQEIILKNNIYTTEQQCVGTAIKTSNWVTVGGKQYFVYKSQRGSKFYVKQSKKGTFYRIYIKS